MTAFSREVPAGAQASLAGDLAAVVPGWLVLLAVDPAIATGVGLPVGAALVAARRLCFPAHAFSGRLAALVWMPLACGLLVASVVCGTESPLVSAWPAIGVVALLEAWNRRLRARPLWRSPLPGTLLVLALTAGLGLLLVPGRIHRFHIEELVKATSAAEDGPRWDARTMREATAAARAAIGRRIAGVRLAGAPSPNGVFVTIFGDDGGRGRGFSDRGADTLEKLLDAARRAASSRAPSASGEFRIQIDVPGRSQSFIERPLFHLLAASYRDIGKFGLVGRYDRVAYELEPGIDGLALKDGGEPVVVLPSDPITEGWLAPSPAGGDTGMTRAILRNAWLTRRGRELDFPEGAVRVRKFRTFGFAELAPGTEPVALLRASPDQPAALTRDELVRRTILAADWLGRQVGERGRFHYESMPPKTRATNDYAFARHSGGAYALMALHRASLARPELGAAGERALNAAVAALSFVKAHAMDPDPDDAVDELCFTDPKTGVATSGATALAALAFALLPEPEAVEDPLQRAAVAALAAEDSLNRLDACILRMIDPDGAVFANRGLARRARFVSEERRYFPGEVLLALTYAYERTRDRRLLEAARRIADRQIARAPWTASWGLPADGDHWVTQGASRLAVLTGDRRYAELSVSYGRGYLRDQVPPGSYLHGDYRGAYKRGGIPGTTLTASAGEAVGAAMRAARFLGRDTGDFEVALVEGALHLARQQFTERSGYYVPAGFDVEGAVRMGIASSHCRIDNNQHSIVAFLAALEAMDRMGAGR